MRIAILCEDTLLREGLECLLANVAASKVEAVAASWDKLSPKVKGGRCEVLILASKDVSSDELSSMSRAAKRHRITTIVLEPLHWPSADFVIKREEGFDGIKRALSKIQSRIASNGVVVAEPVALYGISRDLTPREHEVARLVSQGMPNRRIALVLGIQEQSVKNLVSVVMRKLECENRVQLALHLSSERH